MEKSLYESKNPLENSSVINFNHEVSIENLKQSVQWVIDNNDAFKKRVGTKDKDVSTEYDVKVFGVKNKTAAI